jgi:hypothetical protein
VFYRAKGFAKREFQDPRIIDILVDYLVSKSSYKCDPLTPGVALVGLDAEVKGMNPVSSNGPSYAHVRRKDQLITDDGELEPELAERMMQDLTNSLFGYVRVPRTRWQGKAEVLDKKKIDLRNTRIFSILDLDLNLELRMLLFKICEYILNNFEIFRCTGGINATSKQWDKLRERIFKHANKIFCDQKKFDTKHGWYVFSFCAQLFMRLARKFGYDEKLVLMLGRLVMSAYWQIVEYNGDFVYIEGSLPSGLFLTLILNSLGHLLIFFTAYTFVVSEDPNQFFEEVLLAITGDDVAGTTSNENFNLIVLEQICSERLGYELTSSIKGRKLGLFSEDDEVVFLKRRWRFDEEIQQYVAPLEKESIFKSMLFYQMKSDKTKLVKIMNSLDGLQREMFFHGREDFNLYVESNRDLFKTYNVRELCYDRLQKMYLENNDYFCVWDTFSTIE